MNIRRILIAALLLSTLSASYASAAGTVDYDRDEQVLTVTADGGYFNSGAQITLMMYKSEIQSGSLSGLDKEALKSLNPYFYETKADISGRAVFKIPLADNTKAGGDYIIKLASSTYTDMDEIRCRVYSAEELDKAKDGLIKAIADGTVNGYLENKAVRETLGLDEIYDRVPDKTIVSDSLKKQKALSGIATFADIKASETNAELGIRLFNDMNSMDSWLNIRSFVDSYYLYKGTESAEYAKYKALSDTSAIDKQIFGKRPYSGFAAFERLFCDTVNNPPEGNKTVYSTGGGSGGGGGGGGGSTKITASGNTGGISVSGTATDKPVPIIQPQERAVAFFDIPDDFWARDAIYRLAENGVVSGVGDGIFAPYDTVTREQFLKLLLLSGGIECDAFDCSFTDVDKNAWYYNYIATAAIRGLANGYDDGRFGVGESITREDICTLAYRFISGESNTNGYEADDMDFTDAGNISAYAKEAVAFLKGVGIVSGYPDGTFLPKNTASRAEACKIMIGISDYLTSVKE